MNDIKRRERAKRKAKTNRIHRNKCRCQYRVSHGAKSNDVEVN